MTWTTGGISAFAEVQPSVAGGGDDQAVTQERHKMTGKKPKRPSIMTVHAWQPAGSASRHMGFLVRWHFFYFLFLPRRKNKTYMYNILGRQLGDAVNLPNLALGGNMCS
jgi:hypothetical protein